MVIAAVLLMVAKRQTGVEDHALTHQVLVNHGGELILEEQQSYILFLSQIEETAVERD